MKSLIKENKSKFSLDLVTFAEKKLSWKILFCATDLVLMPYQTKSLLISLFELMRHLICHSWLYFDPRFFTLCQRKKIGRTIFPKYHWKSTNLGKMRMIFAWKVSVFWVILVRNFPVFEFNTEIYSVNLRIQSECRKIRTRKTQNMDTFYTVDYFRLSFLWFWFVGQTYESIEDVFP